MAKALYGHLGQSPLVQASREAALRARVAELEAEVAALTVELRRLRPAALEVPLDSEVELAVAADLDREAALA